MLESANKAFIAGGLDIQYIFTGQSDREAFKKKDLQIQSLEDLLKKLIRENKISNQQPATSNLRKVALQPLYIFKHCLSKKVS